MSGTDVRDRCQGPVSGTDVDVGAPRRPGPARGRRRDEVYHPGRPYETLKSFSVFVHDDVFFANVVSFVKNQVFCSPEVSDSERHHIRHGTLCARGVK
jgi:hypothetical protein